MALDIPKWLKEDLKLSDEQIAIVAPVFQADGRADLVEKGYLRQSDYSRNMNDLSTKIKAFEDSNNALTQEMTDWAVAKANGEKQTKEQRDAMEAAQAEALRLRQIVERKAADLGIDPKTILEGTVTQPQNQPPNPPPFDESKFVSREDFMKAQAALANAAITAPAEIAVIQHEHHELTGEWLDPRTIMDELRTRASNRQNQKSLDLRTIWEEQHNVPTLRETKAKVKYDADIAAAEERGRIAARSEQVLPGAQPRANNSSVLKAVTSQESKTGRPQPGGAVAAAANAFSTGKYQQKAQQPPGGTGRT